MSQYDVLVLGAGVVGLAASLAMSKCKLKVALIDAAPFDEVNSKSSRVYAINAASKNVLQELGAWSFLDCNHVSPYQYMHVWDASNGRFIDFDSRQIGASSLGYIVEERALKQALLQAIALQSSIDLFPNCKINTVQQEPLCIVSGHRVWEGRLLMIADGANSPTRKQLGVEEVSWSYQQHAITASVITEKPHGATAYQVFNREGPLAFLPLPQTHHCSIVWSTDSLRSQQLMLLDEACFNKALTEAFARRLGQVQISSPRQQFPLHMRHVKQYVGRQWLLLGDAAHTIHPLAGLGLNMGLDDVRSWMRCVEGIKSQAFSHKQLAAYQRERKHAVWQTIGLVEGLKQVFSHSSGPLVLLRGLGLNVCNEWSTLKRLFIQHAAGTSFL